VTWAAPNGNGDNAMTYELRRTGGATVYSGSAPTTQLTLSVDTTDQTFEYRAKNKAGWSAWSPASAPIRAFQTPGTVSNIVATATGTNNQVKVTFTAAPGNGALTSEIVYVWNAAGGSGTVASGGTITYGGLANGNSYQISIAARSTVRGETATGTFVPSSPVIPYGPPNAPQVSASGNANNVTLNWNAGSSGNGRPIAEVQIETTDGGVQGGQGISGSTTQGSGRNQTKSIRAHAKDSTGLWGAWSGWASASTWGNPSFNFTNSGVTFTNTCPWGTCEYVNITLSRFDPGKSVRCYAGGIGAPDYDVTIAVTDPGGNWGPAYPKGTAGYPIVKYGNSAAGFGTCYQLP
jgi:large repetitive protein